MDKKILPRQAAIMVVLFTVGSSLVTQGTHRTEQDVWLAVIAAAVVSVPVVLVYARLQRLYPGKSLYEMAYALLGRAGGALTTVLYTLFFLHLALYSVHMFALFLRTTDLPSTPAWAVALPAIFISAWLATLGHTRIAKASTMIFVLVILDILVTLFLAISTYDITHMLPVLEHELPVLANDAYSFIAVPFTQTVVFLCLFQHIPTARERRRGWLLGLGIGALVLAIIYVRTVLILGGAAIGKMNYATYRSSSVIKLDAFIQRVEMFLSDGFVPTLILKTTIFFYAAGQGITQLKPRWRPSCSIPIMAVLIFAAVIFIAPTAAQSFGFFEILRLYASIFQVAVPLLFWVIAEFKTKRRKAAEVG